MNNIKLKFISTLIIGIFCFKSFAQKDLLGRSIINDSIIFEEQDGIVAVEAEFFYKQSLAELRQWYITSKNEAPKIGRDDDAQHCYDASNNAYLEILPDERVTHDDQLIHGENFTNEPGKMGVLSYKVKFNTPGRYYVWVRAFSTGGEDNGIHVGLNGTWPEHGQRMQWCQGKNQWTWESKQRTKEIHCGVPHEIYLDIPNPGIHDIQFSMREDGFEFDKFILTKDIDYVPIEKGPKVIVTHGVLPEPFPEVKVPSYFKTICGSSEATRCIAAQEFPVEGTNFYKNGKNWLAINPKKYEEAKTSTIFNFESGTYDVVFVGVGENDGKSTFTISINNEKIGSYSPELTQRLFEEGKKFNALWKNVSIKKGDTITVTSKIGSDGVEWTRGRWAGIVFTPVGKGESIQNASSTYYQN
ncbi:hypothetical protein [Algibacter luteus]|uniref:hypothetical protein n=1 Tax=Algibacter luteus TaxID=1178825 RepID=UPI0025985663|nr:hypothetical protein [Algibacter luteus]WJJ97742.1 hypothetical protein O5O44_04990 [Algibacter luteus]